jgi:hypothetical protein
MTAAARWIEENAGWHDRVFLFIDEFDELVTALAVAKKFNNSYTTTPTAVAA